MVYDEDIDELYDYAVETLLEIPAFQELFARFGGFIDRAAAAADKASRVANPHYRGPGRAYAAESPPRPRQQRRAAPPPPPPEPKEDPRLVLMFPPEAKLTRDIIKKRQRDLAHYAHPDHGGSLAAMQRINAAAEALLSQIQ